MAGGGTGKRDERRIEPPSRKEDMCAFKPFVGKKVYRSEGQTRETV